MDAEAARWPRSEAWPVPAGLDTPCLVLDLAKVQANIERLQRALDARRVALRPHAKTHKSLRVGRMQLEAGARGLTVGTLGEAEVFAAGGFDDLFVAYPVLPGGSKAARLVSLLERVPRFAVGVDSVEAAARLGVATAGRARRLRVLVEVDPGDHRSGVAGPEEALDVARAARAAGLEVLGLFAHGGHGYRPGMAASAGSDEVRTLTEAAVALEAAGFEAATISAGSTPTMLTAAEGRVNEIRAGTYVFGDRQQWALGAIPAEGCAAAVVATVVSVREDRIVLDAGAKALTKDRAEWLGGFGLIPAAPGVTIQRLSDYHAVAASGRGDPGRPGLGDVVAIVPNHVCPVVDLFDAVTVVRRDGRTEIWPVDARGRSQ
jgi:D-serine deaminase-like pyridoxal phosphate-dependent protein